MNYCAVGKIAVWLVCQIAASSISFWAYLRWDARKKQKGIK